MININIFTFLYIIFYIQLVNTYELNKVLSKNDVLKITNEYHLNFYCKNDICVSTYHDCRNPYIEIPNENGNLTKYITDTCQYNDIKLNKCNSEKCTSDSECLSNKCINNHCVFNDETPIVHCNSIYTSNESTFMHCGKPYNDNCKFNYECSSMLCNNNGFCSMKNRILYKRSITTEDIVFIYIELIFIFAVMPISCCCCYYFLPKLRILIIVYFILFILFILFIIFYRLVIL